MRLFASRVKIICALAAVLLVGFSLWNLVHLGREALEIRSMPLAERRAAAYWSKGGAIKLIRQARGRSISHADTVGLWYTFADEITMTHFRGGLTYHLYPNRFVAVDPTRKDLPDYLLCFVEHYEDLKNELEERKVADQYRIVAENDDCKLLKRQGIPEPALLKSIDSQTFQSQWPYLRLTLWLLFLLGLGLSLHRWISTVFKTPFTSVGASWVAAILLLPLSLLAYAMAGWAGAMLFCIPVFTWVLLGGLRRDGAEATDLTHATEKPPLRMRWQYIFFAIAGVWAVLVLVKALSYPVYHQTGLGVWGLKGAILFREGLSLKFLEDPAFDFCHPNYPLGVPLLLASCYHAMGEVNDWAIKLLPAFQGILFLFLFLRLLVDRGRQSLLAGGMALALCTHIVFTRESTYLQAEPLLWLSILLGFYCLIHYLQSPTRLNLCMGLFFLAGGANIKQEGVVFFLCAAVSLFLTGLIFRPKRAKSVWITELLPLIAIFVCLVLPWQLYSRLHHLHVNDFSAAAVQNRPLQETVSYVWRGALSFLAPMYATVSSVSLIWWIGSVAVIVNIKRIWKDRTNLFLLTTICLIVVGFSCAYGISVYEPDQLFWHLDASQRLLITPTILLILLMHGIQSKTPQQQSGAEAAIFEKETSRGNGIAPETGPQAWRQQ